MRHRISLYTDGSAYPNSGTGGFAAIIRDGLHRKEVSGRIEHCTNNKAELWAVIQGLTNVVPDSHVTVFTDSGYIERAVNDGHLSIWQTNGWRRIRTGQPVMNADLWQVLCETIEQRRLTVQFRKLNAHKGHYFNERADFLARKAAKEGAQKRCYYPKNFSVLKQ